MTPECSFPLPLDRLWRRSHQDALPTKCPGALQTAVHNQRPRFLSEAFKCHITVNIVSRLATELKIGKRTPTRRSLTQPLPFITRRTRSPARCRPRGRTERY